MIHNIAQRLEALASKVEGQPVKIKMKNEGLLEVPSGTDIMDLGVDHFLGLAKKRGWPSISKALINLKIWNKNQNPKLSKWADNMQEQVAAKIEKEREGAADTTAKLPPGVRMVRVLDPGDEFTVKKEGVGVCVYRKPKGGTKYKLKCHVDLERFLDWLSDAKTAKVKVVFKGGMKRFFKDIK